MGGIISRLRQVHSLTNLTSLSLFLFSNTGRTGGFILQARHPKSENRSGITMEHRKCQASCQDRDTRLKQPHSKHHSTLSADKISAGTRQGALLLSFVQLDKHSLGRLETKWSYTTSEAEGQRRQSGFLDIFIALSPSAHAHASVDTKVSNNTGLEASDNAICKMLVPVQP